MNFLFEIIDMASLLSNMSEHQVTFLAKVFKENLN